MSIAEIEITLPFGAHFYQNIHFLVYKQFTRFLYRLNCLSPNQKCKDCPLKDSCRYYRMTGENFSQYPCYLIDYDAFAKRMYQPQDIVTIRFYFIGKYQETMMTYLRLFFTDYLKQKLGGSDFYLKSVSLVPFEEKMMVIQQMRFCSVIESQNIQLVCEQLLDYYQKCYGCSVNLSKNPWKYELKSCKEVSLGKLSLPTHHLFIHGFLPNITFQSSIEIPNWLRLVGLGQFNCIGGGRFET